MGFTRKNSRIKNTKILSVLFSAVLGMSAWASVNPAAAITNDFDGDGLTDIVIAKKNKNNSTNTGTTVFTIRSSRTGAISQNTLPIPGDAFYTYRDASGGWRPGVVWVKSVSEPLVWMTRTASGGILSSVFGLVGDIITNQVDVDFDGITDRTLVRRTSNGSYRWYSELSSAGGAIVETVFGENGDYVGIEPGGRYIVLRYRPSTGEIFVWFSRHWSENFLGPTIQWGLTNDIPQIPLFAGQRAIVRDNGSAQAAFVRHPNGTFQAINVCASGTIPNMGAFFQNRIEMPDFACMRPSTGAIRAVNTATGGSVDFNLAHNGQFILAGNGQVFVPGGDPRVPGGSSGGGSDDSGSGSGGTPPTNPGLASRCPTVRALFRGEIYKDIASTHIPTSDPRRFSTSFITRSGTPRPSFNCLEAFDSNGNKVHQLGFYGAGGEYSSRYYGGSGCGDKKSGDSIAATARAQSGSPAIHIKVNSNTCVRVPNAGSCFNSSAC